MMGAPVLIVGASLAGLRTAESLRARGFVGKIILCGTENHEPYNRPPLSKDILKGTATLDSLTLKPSRGLEPVEWRLGLRAVAADLSAKKVTFDDGSVQEYGTLVVATGVSPRLLNFTEMGFEAPSLRTIEDAVNLKSRLKPASNLLIVGSGFIGCEVAASARSIGVNVSVVSVEAAPLETAIGADLAGVLYQRHVTEGVRFHLEDQIVGGSAQHSTVELASGETVKAETVLQAVGSSPNVGWLDGNNLDLSDGLICDDNLRVVGTDGVYAVGDVARFPNSRFDDIPRRVEHWNVAVETARRAARSIASIARGDGELTDNFEFMPAFWSNQYDIRLQAYGMTRLADRITPMDEELAGNPIMAYYRNDELTAVAALTNSPRLVELASEIRMVTPAAR